MLPLLVGLALAQHAPELLLGSRIVPGAPKVPVLCGRPVQGLRRGCVVLHSRQGLCLNGPPRRRQRVRRERKVRCRAAAGRLPMVDRAGCSGARSSSRALQGSHLPDVGRGLPRRCVPHSQVCVCHSAWQVFQRPPGSRAVCIDQVQPRGRPGLYGLREQALCGLHVALAGLCHACQPQLGGLHARCESAGLPAGSALHARRAGGWRAPCTSCRAPAQLRQLTCSMLSGTSRPQTSSTSCLRRAGVLMWFTCMSAGSRRMLGPLPHSPGLCSAVSRQTAGGARGARAAHLGSPCA